MLRFSLPERKNIASNISAATKEGLQPVSASSIYFVSIIEGGAFWVEKYEIFFFKAQVAFFRCRVKTFAFVEYFPGDFEGGGGGLQFPDVVAKASSFPVPGCHILPVFIVPILKPTRCQASVGLSGVVVLPEHCRLVHHRPCLTSTTQGAYHGTTPAIACSWGVLLLVHANFGIVLGQVLAHIGHASVGNLQGISVHDFMEWVVCGEAVVYYFEKFCTYISSHIQRIRGVEPCYLSTPASFFAAAGGGDILHSIIIATFFPELLGRGGLLN